MATLVNRSSFTRSTEPIRFNVPTSWNALRHQPMDVALGGAGQLSSNPIFTTGDGDADFCTIAATLFCKPVALPPNAGRPQPQPTLQEVPEKPTHSKPFGIHLQRFHYLRTPQWHAPSTPIHQVSFRITSNLPTALGPAAQR